MVANGLDEPAAGDAITLADHGRFLGGALVALPGLIPSARPPTMRGMSQTVTIWYCPTCLQPVGPDDAWTEAEGGIDVPGFGSPPRADEDVAWGRRVRFHQGHFRDRISFNVYRRTAT
jgi:hypothetical protein